MAKGRAFDALRKAWLEQLAHERRASPHTLRAYGDDAARFGGFLTNHFGGTVSETTLAKLAPADIRAFITHRRAEGLGAGGVQRALAAMDPLSRYVDTEGAETLPPSHTHFTAKGTLEIGHRFATALLEIIERK